MWTSEVKLLQVKGICRGIWAITPKSPVKTNSRQSRTEENRREEATQKVQHEAEPVIQEAEQETGRKEIEALLLNEELDEYNLSDRMKDFEWEGTV